jgi:WSC domain
MPCNGNSSEFCGGSSRINIYDFNRTVVPPPAPSWSLLGCYTDSVAKRSLSVGTDVPGGANAMTVEACLSACKASGYTLAGLEYAGECFCDSSIRNDGGPAADGNAQCNMACKGNASETCGGSNRLNLYSFGSISDSPNTSATTSSSTAATLSTSTSSILTPTPSASGWSSAGCYVDSVDKRTLSVPFELPADAGEMTIEGCTALCQSEGFKIAGLEYAGECYCDNSIRNGGSLETDTTTGCNMACKGDPDEICGGSNRLSVYTFGVVITSSSLTSLSVTSSSATSISATAGNSSTTPPATSTVSETSTTITGTSSSSASTAVTSSAGTAHNVPEGWSYSGCYNDNINGRVLGYNNPDSDTLTVESCISQCAKLGYSVAGLEYTKQCFCGKYIINDGTLASSDDQCGMPCSGDDTEKCGGPDRMSIYYKGDLSIYGVPKPQKSDLPGSWTYKGCLT